MKSRVSCASALAMALLSPICGLATVLPAQSVAAEGAATILAIRSADAKEGARLTLTLSAVVAATARPVSDPDRIVIDLPEVALSPAAAANLPRNGDFVSDYRFGPLGPGKSRLVLELRRKACVSRLDEAGESGMILLALELKDCDARQFAAAVAAAPVVAVASTPAPLPVIVLDPGHGGNDSGARGVKGAVEKTIVFDFASELRRQLDATRRFRIVMTRDGDEYVSLEDRAQIARDANASLMISIHADTFPSRSATQAEDVFGTTIYTCSDRASDAEAARIAAHENAADRSGDAKGADDSGVADILFDLKRRESRAYAHMFSRNLAAELRGPGRLNKHPERSAGFFVLKAPDYPSVLVELGYLSNPEDVANMTDPQWRERSVAATVMAVERFFAANPAKDLTKDPAKNPDKSEGAPPAHAVAKSDQAAEAAH